MKHLRLALASLLLVVSGCAQIPSEGPVEQISVPAVPAGIDIAPQPPQPDAIPERVLDGFLLSMADPESDFEIARQYLDPAIADVWDPAAGTTIYTGSILEEDGRFWLRGAVVGALDRGGRFSADGSTLSHDFDLREVDGQWRIGNPPDGVLLTRYLFERFYTPLTIQYFAPGDTHLVPEVLTVPEVEANPTRIVEALLAGPGKALEGVVRNAVPAGVSLGPDGASIDDAGVVTVDFAGLDANMAGEARRRLGAQLLWSMSSLPRVSGLRVTVGGWPVVLPGEGADGVLQLATLQGYSVLAQSTSQDLFAVRAGVPGKVTDNDAFHPLRANLTGAAEVAVSIDGSRLGLVDADRRTVRIGGFEGPLQTVEVGLTSIRGSQWADGQFHALGEDPQGRTQLFTIDFDGSHRLVDVRLPAGFRVLGVAVNPTGVTAAVLASSGEQVALGTMTFVEDTVLDRWSRLPVLGQSGEHLGTLRDVEWNSEATLVVSGATESGHEIAVVQSDGSQVEELGGVEDHITALAALPRPGGGLIALRSGNGSVWRYSAPNRWAKSPLVLDSIAFAG